MQPAPGMMAVVGAGQLDVLAGMAGALAPTTVMVLAPPAADGSGPSHSVIRTRVEALLANHGCQGTRVIVVDEMRPAEEVVDLIRHVTGF